MFRDRLTALLDPALATVFPMFGFFDDNGGSGSGGGDGNGDGDGGDGDGDGAGDGGDAGDAGKTFSQQDVDRIVKDRVARAKKDVADYDDLKTKAEEYDKIKKERQSEEERLREALSSKEKVEATLNDTVQELRAQIAVEREAWRAGVTDLEAAWRLIDSDALDYDDNGLPTNAEDVVKKLVEDRPYLKDGKAGPAPSTSSAAKPPTRSRGEPEPAPGRARMREAYGSQGG